MGWSGRTYVCLGVAFAIGMLLLGGWWVYALVHMFDCDPYCNAWQGSPIANGSGEVAIERREYSEGFLDVGDYEPVPNAVYVHRVGISNSNANLALRYYSLETEGSLPIVKWTGKDSVLIVVPAKSIVQVTRRLSNVDGIAVTINLPRAVCAPTTDPSERPKLAQTCDYSKEMDAFLRSIGY